MTLNPYKPTIETDDKPQQGRWWSAWILAALVISTIPVGWLYGPGPNWYVTVVFIIAAPATITLSILAVIHGL